MGKKKTDMLKATREHADAALQSALAEVIVAVRARLHPDNHRRGGNGSDQRWPDDASGNSRPGADGPWGERGGEGVAHRGSVVAVRSCTSSR